ncbi:thiol-disulfide oxidoreductase DCC family protein [Serratia sp. NPDC078593]|uniref:thiol-disulfide oxidoreductase DCC family protein n=1 Tax=unclassified Serratia (in: enterobacteria) TaxID=2647522 RepID=UPI0037D85F66
MKYSAVTPSAFVAEPVILFDGECNLCHGVVRFLIHADRAGRIRLATVQSPTGQAMLRQLAMPTDRFDSVVLVASGQYWLRSAAFFHALSRLDRPYRWLSIGRFLPQRLADAIYDVIARHRYQWFGRNDGRTLPGSAQSWRYLPGGGGRQP